MHTLDYAAAFRKNLVETGGYRTDPARPVSILGRCDAWYYLRVLAFLWEGWRLARRGQYTDPVFGAHSLGYLTIVEECGGKFDISGFEHPTRLGMPCVYIGNHMSLLEAFVIPALMLSFNRIAAVAKESLFHYPLLGPITRAINPIAVRRENPREDLKAVLEQGKLFLEQGRSIVIFPQATRSPGLDRKAFNSLGVKLAKYASAPVIPLALKTDFQRNGRIIKDIGPLDRGKSIHLRLGAPLRVEGNGKETNEKVMDFIESCLAEWSSK